MCFSRSSDRAQPAFAPRPRQHHPWLDMGHNPQVCNLSAKGAVLKRTSKPCETYSPLEPADLDATLLLWYKTSVYPHSAHARATSPLSSPRERLIAGPMIAHRKQQRNKHHTGLAHASRGTETLRSVKQTPPESQTECASSAELGWPGGDEERLPSWAAVQRTDFQGWESFHKCRLSRGGAAQQNKMFIRCLAAVIPYR